MRSSACPDASLNIGIPACGVEKATVSAALVMPGVDASCWKVGARLFGDGTSNRSTA